MADAWPESRAEDRQVLLAQLPFAHGYAVHLSPLVQDGAPSRRAYAFERGLVEGGGEAAGREAGAEELA